MAKKKGSKKKERDSALRGFRALAMRVQDGSDEARYVFFKEHHEKQDNDSGIAPGHTLFAVNIPHTFSSDDVMSVFSVFGSVQMVLFDDLPTAGIPISPFTLDRPVKPAQSARIVFEEAESVQKAMEMDLGDVLLPYEKGTALTGMKKWLEEYKVLRPNSHAMQMQIDRFMEAFDDREEQQRVAAKSGPVIDEDGFMLITRSKKKPQLLSKSAAANPIDKKKRKKEMINFYSFQRKQQKQMELAVLRKKFEEDKKRVVRMKEARKFVPF